MGLVGGLGGIVLGGMSNMGEGNTVQGQQGKKPREAIEAMLWVLDKEQGDETGETEGDKVATAVTGAGWFAD